MKSQAEFRAILIENGFLELRVGGYNYFGDGQASIYLLTEKSQNLADGCTFICSKPAKPVKINYSKASQELPNIIEESREFQEIVTQVERLNEFLAMHPFKIHGTIYQGGLRRKFNHGRLDSGGRYYPGYVTIAKEIIKDDGTIIRPRKLAEIDGESISEVDLKAAFPSILAAQTGWWWPEGLDDPYQLIPWVEGTSGDERDLAKILISAFIMTDGQLTQCPASLRKYKPRKGERPRRYLEVISKHGDQKLIEGIKKGFPFLTYPFRGQNTVFWESEIITRTMIASKDIGIPCYPLHDALFTKKSDAEVVKKLMSQEFLKEFSYKPIISIK